MSNGFIITGVAFLAFNLGLNIGHLLTLRSSESLIRKTREADAMALEDAARFQ